MLILTDFIGKGSSRICFKHPTDAEKCVKIPARFKEIKSFNREISAFYAVKAVLHDFCATKAPFVVDTNLGKGLACEAFFDSAGTPSKPLGCFIKHGQLDSEAAEQLNFFAYNLMAHDLFFYDFNVNNFVVQIKNGKKQLKYIDMKSFCHYKGWCFLKLENVFAPLARLLMKRRLKRLFRQCGLKA